MTTAQLPKKIATRREHTGDPALDRVQRQAQDVTAAHEQTKAIVAALANSVSVALTTDKMLAGSAGVYTTLLTASITTTLASGNLDITFTASGVHQTNQGTTYFKLFVDNVFVRGCYSTVGIGFAFSEAIVARAAIARGAHTIRVDWSTDTN